MIGPLHRHGRTVMTVEDMAEARKAIAEEHEKNRWLAIVENEMVKVDDWMDKRRIPPRVVEYE